MNKFVELKQKGQELKHRISVLIEENGVWRTVRGRKVFIREGETPTEAISRQDRKWGTRIRRGKDMGSRPASSTPKLTGEEEHKKEWGLGGAGGIAKLKPWTPTALNPFPKGQDRVNPFAKSGAGTKETIAAPSHSQVRKEFARVLGVTTLSPQHNVVLNRILATKRGTLEREIGVNLNATDGIATKLGKRVSDSDIKKLAKVMRSVWKGLP